MNSITESQQNVNPSIGGYNVDRRHRPATKNPYTRQIRRRRNEILGWTTPNPVRCQEDFLKLWVLPSGFIYYVEILKRRDSIVLFNESVPFGRQLTMPAWEFIEMFGPEWRESLLQKIEEVLLYPGGRKFLDLLHPIQLIGEA